MAVKGAQKARWTMAGPIPEITKLPKPWKMFGQGSAPWPPHYDVLVTDGRSVWMDHWGNCLNGDWKRALAWCEKPKAPDLGLVWPEREVFPPIPRLTPEEIASLRESSAAQNALRPQFTIPPGGVLERDEDW